MITIQFLQKSAEQAGMSEFHQSCILLALTALVSGLLVPYVLKQIDERRTREKQHAQAGAARQAKIIEAQSKLLDDLATRLWRWRYLCIRLTFCAGGELHAEYQTAWQRYHERIWPLSSRIRNEISRARRLASETTYQSLLAFYGDMVAVDKQLMQLHLSTAPDRVISYLDLNYEIYNDVTARIEALLDDLASEFRLKGRGNRKEVSDGNGSTERADAAGHRR